MVKSTKAKKNRQETENVETDTGSEIQNTNGVSDATVKKRGKNTENKPEVKSGSSESVEVTNGQPWFASMKSYEQLSLKEVDKDVKKEEAETIEEPEPAEETNDTEEKNKPEVKQKATKRGGKQTAASRKKAKVSEEEKPTAEEETKEETAEEEEPTAETEVEAVSKKTSKRVKQTGGNSKKKLKAGEESRKDYEVEQIIDVRNKKDGKQEFLIRWKGYSAKDDTWEPEDNLKCENLIKEYLETHEAKEDVTKDSGNRANKRGAAKKKAEKESKEDTNYEVEKIINSREKNGKREFLIRWKGYKAKDDTWEPEANLSCKKLIDEYTEKEAGKETTVTTKRGRVVKSRK